VYAENAGVSNNTMQFNAMLYAGDGHTWMCMFHTEVSAPVLFHLYQWINFFHVQLQHDLIKIDDYRYSEFHCDICTSLIIPIIIIRRECHCISFIIGWCMRCILTKLHHRCTLLRFIIMMVIFRTSPFRTTIIIACMF